MWKYLPTALLFFLGAAEALATSFGRGGGGVHGHHKKRIGGHHCSASATPLPRSQNMTGLEMVHVVYGTDEKTFPGLITSMISLADHLHDPQGCTIHLIIPKESMAKAHELVECFENEMRDRKKETPIIMYHELRDLPFNLKSLMPAYVRTFGGSASKKLHKGSFARVYISDYLPDVRRALWMDTDTIVRGDITPYFQMEMTHPLSGAPDVAGWSTNKMAQYPELMGRLGQKHFNAGVVLIDLAIWRQQNITQKLEKIIKKDAVTQQISMNLALRDNFHSVDWRWNTLEMDSFPLCKTAGGSFLCTPRDCMKSNIIHMAGGEKISDNSWSQKKKERYGHLYMAFVPKRTCPALKHKL